MSAAIQEFDFSVNLLRALLWRHDDASNLQSVLSQKEQWYLQNQTEFWENWFTDVFNLETANDFGCSVWALILGVPLNLITPPNQGPQFGFGVKPGGTWTNNHRYNFNRGNFGVSSAGAGLSLAQKRILLQLRYYKLISRCTVPEINERVSAILADQGSVYVLDSNNMQFITYVFGFQPNSALQFILENFDVLPRPAGVGIKYIISTRPAFGFGTFNKNFNNGTFWAEN
jgi:hypothetical protein